MSKATVTTAVATLATDANTAITALNALVTSIVALRAEAAAIVAAVAAELTGTKDASFLAHMGRVQTGLEPLLRAFNDGPAVALRTLAPVSADAIAGATASATQGLS